jgi:1-acyl-sn-glycerol-3-phosphate acyltransferase
MTNPDVCLKTVFSLLVTCLLWLYFTVGFGLFFSPFYGWAYVFSKHRESAFQHLNHYFFRGFFFLLRCLAPGVKWRISNNIRSIKSSVVVSNHLSYLDPLLMIVLFPRHKTIVKSSFFKVPLFGWLIEQSGFIPATTQGSLSPLMIERIESLDEFLASGGILFIFPEGTRSRDGRIGPFNKGAFKIAGHCQAPIQVLRITGTDKLFKPGRSLFNAVTSATIAIEKIAQIDPDKSNGRASLSDTMSKVRALMQQEPSPE